MSTIKPYLELIKPSLILKQLLSGANLAIMGYSQSEMVRLLDTVSVTSTIVGSLQYFKVAGVRKWKFAYRQGHNTYLFETKEDMTSAIRTLASGVSLTHFIQPHVSLVNVGA